MTNRQDAAKEVLRTWAGRDDVSGLAIVSRDGLPLMTEFSVSCNEDAVCAMAAAIVGAGDAALLDLAGDGTRVARIEGGKQDMQIAPLDEDLLLLLLAPHGTEARWQDAAKEIQAALAGG